MRDGRVRVAYARNALHDLGNEQADIRIGLEPELRQQIILPGNGIERGQRGDVVRQLTGHFVGLAEFALQMDEKRLHDWLSNNGALSG